MVKRLLIGAIVLWSAPGISKTIAIPTTDYDYAVMDIASHTLFLATSTGVLTLDTLTGTFIRTSWQSGNLMASSLFQAIVSW